MDRSASIGVFDSGIGGLSVWRELAGLLPGESMIYVADSANAPYGTKSRNFIAGRSMEITRFLAGQGCKLIVVACNTATGAAITTLRQEFDLPFIGVEPAIKPAAMDSKTGHIGVLATEQTFNGEHFKRTLGLFASSVEVHEKAGNGLVELIENGLADSQETIDLLIKYLMPMVEQGIDQLVLGCTHYPFVIPIIEKILPPGIRIINPAPAVARQTGKVLKELDGLNPGLEKGHYRFFTTGNPRQFKMVLEQLTGSEFPVGQLLI